MRGRSGSRRAMGWLVASTTVATRVISTTASSSRAAARPTLRQVRHTLPDQAQNNETDIPRTLSDARQAADRMHGLLEPGRGENRVIMLR